MSQDQEDPSENDGDWGSRLRPSPSSPVGAGAVVSKIEALLEVVVDRVTNHEELAVQIFSRKESGRHGQLRGQAVRFPGRTVQEAQKFARVLLILQLSHTALVTGNILTKRHIYYQHQELFGSQSRVDEIVDDLALTFDVDRHDLNIVASAKGIFCGDVQIRLVDDTPLDAASAGEIGMPIPAVKSIQGITFGDVEWVLVVEKDATFRSLAASKFGVDNPAGRGILVTAKGYPDLITRNLLQYFNQKRSQIPILCLVDYDPDGLNIYRCYRWGSDFIRQNQTSAVFADIHYLGIRSADILHLKTYCDAAEAILQRLPENNDAGIGISSTESREPVAPLTSRDRKKATEVISKLKGCAQTDPIATDALKELQIMMMLGVKAEIQAVDESGDLTEWLNKAIVKTFAQR